MKKMEKIAFPVDFLKRWVLATNEKMTQEELDKDFDKMLDELKWHLAKDQLMKEYKIDVQKEEVEGFRKTYREDAVHAVRSDERRGRDAR